MALSSCYIFRAVAAVTSRWTPKCEKAEHRKRTHVHTHRQTHRITTVTLDAHACRGLTSEAFQMQLW